MTWSDSILTTRQRENFMLIIDKVLPFDVLADPQNLAYYLIKHVGSF